MFAARSASSVPYRAPWRSRLRRSGCKRRSDGHRARPQARLAPRPRASRVSFPGLDVCVTPWRPEMIHRAEYKGRWRTRCSSPALRFTVHSQRWPHSQLCLTGLFVVATLVTEALSAGFADTASTAIPAHSEAKGHSLTGDLQRVRRVSRGPPRARRNRLR